MTRRRWRLRVTRDLALFNAGLWGFVYEVTVGGGRPQVLTPCVTILLAPVVLGIDRPRRRDESDDEDG